MSNSSKTILVTGATGQQGSAVAKHLLKNGWAVSMLVRDASKPAAQALAKQGAKLVKGDMNDRASLDAALKNVYGVFSVQNYWLPEVGAEGEVRQGKNLADAAKAAGVKHFVYSSVGAAHRGMGQKHFTTKWEIEQHIQKLGLPYTILRPAAFMENYNWSRLQILNGTFTGFGLRADKGIQIIAVDDIGAFVALAFEKPQEFAGKTIGLSGDELTEQQIADTFARVIGRSVKLVPPTGNRRGLDPEEMAAMGKFFNGEAYSADTSSLRKIYPGLKTLEKFLRTSGWENAEPVMETANAWGS